MTCWRSFKLDRQGRLPRSMAGAPGRIRTRDPLLRRSFHAGCQPAAFLIRAGLLIVWLQLNVSGLRSVLARGWHGACLSMRTTGGVVGQGRSHKWLARTDLPGVAPQRCSCGTLLLYSNDLTLKRQPSADAVDNHL